MFLSCVIVRTF